MAYTTIDKPTDYFNGLAYTGTNTSTSYNNGLDMSTNGGLVWLKVRNAAGDHGLFDSVRGATKRLQSNQSSAEDTLSGLTSFDSTGFTLGTAYNDTPYTFMSWSWLAGGSASSNTDGSITTSVSANTTAGFSIVSWVGNATGSATIGHGLGVKPKVFFCKNRTDVDSWVNWQDTTNDGTADVRMNLNQTAADRNDHFITFGTSTITLPSSVDNGWNGSSDDMIAYCFAEKQGYSKFGSYTGNANSDGTFVYTGFKPAFVMTKKTSSSTARNWCILDNKRSSSGANVVNDRLFPNLSDAEDSSTSADFLSNGFKFRDNAGEFNQPVSYIYMAFASNPFVTSTGIPTTAR